MKSGYLIAVLLAVAAPAARAAPAAGQDKPLRVVPSMDLGQYMGSWYEVARYPNGFQKKCAGEVLATYTRREDGRIDVLNQCRKEDGELQSAQGVARPADEDGPNTKLEVRFAPAFLSFLPMVWGKYWVIDLAPDYSYAVVGEPGRKYLWVLSRTPQMDEETYRGILQRLEDQDFPIARLVKTRQEPSAE